MPASRKKKNTKPEGAEDGAEGESGSATEAATNGASRPDDMPADVLEFVTAIDDYKRLKRRPFPNWSEVLEIIKQLGYQRSSR